MDTSKLSQGQIVAAAGGALLIVSLFLSWASGPFGGSASAFDLFSGMDIIMLLIGIAAIGFAGATAADAGSGLPSNMAWIVCALGLITFGWALGWDLENSSAGIGAWLGLIAAGGIAYGAYSAAHETVAGTVSSRPAARPTAPPPAAPSGSSSEPPSSAPPPGA